MHQTRAIYWIIYIAYCTHQHLIYFHILGIYSYSCWIDMCAPGVLLVYNSNHNRENKNIIFYHGLRLQCDINSFSQMRVYTYEATFPSAADSSILMALPVALVSVVAASNNPRLVYFYHYYYYDNIYIYIQQYSTFYLWINSNSTLFTSSGFYIYVICTSIV